VLGLVRSVADHAREVRVWTDGPERVAPSHKIQNERSVRWQKQQRSWMRRDRELHGVQIQEASIIERRV
jgi:hypothetical protein